MTQDALDIALCHLAPTRGKTEDNRASLLAAARTGAERGARLIVAPELAVNGYGFRDRDEARATAESADGPTAALLTDLCAEREVWCATGFLEVDGPSGDLFNSAMLVGPAGVVGVHRKLVPAERRWMTAGEDLGRPLDTPWGPMGLLVCADAYYSWAAHDLAEQGARALVCVNAWPATGLDPRRLWRARALENGLTVIAANRTGHDDSFDARSAPSAVFGPDGTCWTELVSAEPQVLTLRVPLKTAGFVRPTSPPFDPRPFAAFVAEATEGTPSTRRPGGRVEVLPSAGTGGRIRVAGLEIQGDDPSPRVDDTGDLRVGRLGLDLALRPEATLRLIDAGCDLIVVLADQIDDALVDPLLLRCLDRAAVALVTSAGTHLALPPDDHRAPEVRFLAPGMAHVVPAGWSIRTGGAWDTHRPPRLRPLPLRGVGR